MEGTIVGTNDLGELLAIARRGFNGHLAPGDRFSDVGTGQRALT